jgi:hypothetical protein
MLSPYWQGVRPAVLPGVCSGQTWPKHQLHGCGNYWILLRGDAPNFTAFSLATLERFTTSPVQIFGSKQDPFISALA